ncbi:Small GTP-binding protein domain [Trinorchestia longiramus]|nr:Small GTP-binding protein domain [Trinorchestia longiramus]
MCSCVWWGMVGVLREMVWGLAALVQPAAHVVLVGLEGAGKTTALLRLRYGQYVEASPTVAFNTEKVRVGGGSWLIWDVGGAERLRPLWRPYTRACDALIFVVDSCSDAERLEEARLELHRLMKQQANQCSTLHRPKPPILVIANKQDLPGSRTPSSLSTALGLPDLQDSQPWAIAPACSVTGEGLEEAMGVLHHLVAKSRRVPSQSSAPSLCASTEFTK